MNVKKQGNTGKQYGRNIEDTGVRPNWKDTKGSGMTTSGQEERNK